MINIEQQREIAPTILTSEYETAQSQLAMVLRLEPRIKRFHIDIITQEFLNMQQADGKPTLPLEQWKQLLDEADFPNDIPIDVHLMTVDPTQYITACKEIGAQRVYGHIEHMAKDAQARIEFIAAVTQLGMEAGLALDLATPLEEISEIIDQTNLSAILFLAVAAGKQGQTFHDEVIEKIIQLRALGFTGPICIDGNMNKDTIPRCLAAGATYVGVGSALVRAKDQEQMQQNWDKLQ
jgi:ribulose-phosphate 3-epimerase